MSTIAIIELPSFNKKAAILFRTKELDELKKYLMIHPDKGDIIPSTGGIRKMRWTSGDKGKRGGARVIYFYYIYGSEIFLMTCYSKKDQEDISPSEKKQLRKTVKLLTGKGK